ncbi:MAG: hypothetical protein WCO44_02805 [Bacteroidota bacterium]
METTLTPGTSILIIKPKMTRSFYNLTRGEDNIGTINFPKTFGTLAEVKLFEEEWSLKRMGFWKPYITVRRQNATQDYLQVPFSGKFQGLLAFSAQNGESYELTQTGFWNPKWVWIKHKRALIEYDLKFGMKKYAEAIIWEKDDLLPLLFMIGSYGLIMQGWDETAAATSVIA